MPKKAKKAMRLGARIRANLRGRMVSGLLVVIPLGITAFVLHLVYSFTAGYIAPLIKTVFGQLPGYAVAALAMGLFLAILYLVGLIATAVAGRRLIAMTEAIIQRIPLVKSVYGASKQVVKTFSVQDQRSNFRAAVLVEFPYPGMKAVGFVMGRTLTRDGAVFYRVFIPTTPNITVGLFQLVAPQDVCHCDLSVEDAVKMVVSAGILAPERLRSDPVAAAPARVSRPRGKKKTARR